MDYLHAIAVGIQLGNAALRSVPVFHNHVFHLHIIVDRMDCHFRFNFKALGKNRKCLDKFVAERSVAGHDILDIGMK